MLYLFSLAVRKVIYKIGGKQTAISVIVKRRLLHFRLKDLQLCILNLIEQSRKSMIEEKTLRVHLLAPSFVYKN